MKPAVIQAWQAMLGNHSTDALDALLADDVVFESPVVFRPQAGRALTSLYLRAADAVLNNGSFRYVGEWYAAGSAVLEFEAQVRGVAVNGVDMIWWNDAGRIVRFKVMVRPLQAIGVLREQMGAELQRLAPEAVRATAPGSRS
jgi:hypothetical protein